MKVLVTGPDGVLGSNLVRELLKNDYEVLAMSENGKKSPTIDDLPITKIGGNILDKDNMIQATKGVDVVIHCAANTSMYPPRQDIINKVNIEGTVNMIDACLENNVKRFIYVGTANSFASGSIDNPGTEKNHYAAEKYGLDYMDSKYKGQLIVMEAVKNRGLDAIVVNPTFMIGPYDSGPSSGAMIIGLYNGKIPGYTTGGKNFVAVKDVATAITNAIKLGVKGEAYILGNENLSYKQAFDKMATITKTKPIKRSLNAFTVKTYGWISSFFAKIFKFKPSVTYQIAVLSSEEHYYSAEKARQELKMPVTPLEVAFKESFDWFIEHKYVEIK